jgi:hypothetical protein
MWKKNLCIIAGLITLTVTATQTKAYCPGLTAGATAYMNAVWEIELTTETDVTEDEIELLAKLITAEVGGVDEEASYLCGSVVINRMNSEKFPNTLEEVIYQKGQYQCSWNGALNKDYTDLSWEIAEELLTEGTIIPDNVVWQSEFAQGDGIYKQVGRTYFCYSEW